MAQADEDAMSAKDDEPSPSAKKQSTVKKSSPEKPSQKLKPASSRRFLTVHIENLFGDDRITVRIDENATIEDLRATIVDPRKPGAESQLFLYGDVPLSDETRTLKSYDVEDGALLIIVPHMKAGPRRKEIDKGTVRRAVQSAQREAMELVKYAASQTAAVEAQTSSSLEEADDDVYAFETTPDKRLRLIKYAAKPGKKICADKKKDEAEQVAEDKLSKITKNKMKMLLDKLASRKSPASSKSPSPASSVRELRPEKMSIEKRNLSDCGLSSTKKRKETGKPVPGTSRNAKLPPAKKPNNNHQQDFDERSDL